MFWQKLQKWGFWMFIFLVLFFMASYFIFGDDVSTETLRQSIKDFGIGAPFVFILVYIFGTIFIPSTPFMLVAGFLFGIKYGFIYTTIGGILSSLLTFEISRKLGKNWVENILEHKYFTIFKKYNEKLQKSAIWDLVFLRILPIMPFNVLNIFMGVSKIKIKHYLIGTFIGLIPSNFLTVVAGALLAKIF